MSSINLGPFNANKPTVGEKANIRQSLGLYSAALLDATFTTNGNALTFTDPNDLNKTVTLDKARLTSNIADSLANSQSFSMIGDVSTVGVKLFNGTAGVELQTSINVGSISSSKLADNAVITSKIANSTISPEKLSVGAPAWTSTTFVTGANTSSFGSASSGTVALKIGASRSGTGESTVELVATAASTTANSKISRAGGTDGILSISNSGTGDFKITQEGNAPIVFSINSLERVRIGNNGRMTIEAPSSELATLYLKTSAVGTAGSPALFVDPPVGVTSQRAAATFGDWQIGQDSLVTGVKDFYVWQGGSTNTQRVNIGASGNVGLGKVAGTGIKLDVDGTVKATQLSGPVDDLSITTGKLANSAVTAAKLDGAQTGSAPIYGARAWVSFSGTTAGTFAGGNSTVTRAAGSTLCTVTTASPHGLTTGNYVSAVSAVAIAVYPITRLTATTFTFTTVATTALTGVSIAFAVRSINGSGNVNSIAYASVGSYWVNMTIALSSVNYAVSWGGTTNGVGGSTYANTPDIANKNSSSFSVSYRVTHAPNTGTGIADQPIVDLVVYQ